MAEATAKRVRTCVACANSLQKGELMRIVRMSDGSVRFDATGRVPGRGAYVCNEACLAEAMRTKRLQRALKTAISEDEAARILSECRECASRDEIR